MNGLIWQKAILHVHTPWGNLDAGETLSSDYQLISSEQEFLEKFIEKGIEILGITDHHKIKHALHLRN